MESSRKAEAEGRKAGGGDRSEMKPMVRPFSNTSVLIFYTVNLIAVHVLSFRPQEGR